MKKVWNVQTAMTDLEVDLSSGKGAECHKGLVTNYGEGGVLQNGKVGGGGGACEVLPLRKAGGGGRIFF